MSIKATSSSAYLELTGCAVDYRRLRDRVAYLSSIRGSVCLHVRMEDAGYSVEDHDALRSDFATLADEVVIGPLVGWSASGEYDFLLGTSPMHGQDGHPLAPLTVCPRPFYSLAVTWDGEVVVCCADWTRSTRLGNVHQQTLAAIWRGDALRSVRLNHLQGRRGCYAGCADCQFSLGTPAADRLDDRAGELEAVLTRSLQTV